MKYKICNDDIVNWCKTYTGDKFHAILCDSPYELKFMNHKWDSTGIAFRPETWEGMKQHLFPGAFGMTFGGSRTAHRIASAIEDAGFIIHPMIVWCYGSGFPKATRVKGHEEFDGHRYGLQALKPAAEPIIVFQKPFDGKPVDNMVANGSGALNIDGGRIPSEPYTINTWDDNAHPFGDGAGNEFTSREQSGRWPANFIIDDTVSRSLDAQSGHLKSGKMSPEISKRSTNGSPNGIYGKFDVDAPLQETYGDSGGASRFFFNVQTNFDEADPFVYEKKVSQKERNAGMGEEKNTHPTLKSISLTKYLATLLLPPVEYAPRRLLVPFSGTGSEGIGGALSGWEYIEMIELGKEYCEIAEKRFQYWTSKI